MQTLTRRQSLQQLSSALLATTLAVSLAACGGGSDSPGPMMAVQADGRSNFDAAAVQNTLATYALQPVSAAEAQGLAFMREEEMLAQAVYLSSAQRWPATVVFANIAASEATHTAAVKALLDRYGLPDPLAGLPTGTLASPAFLGLQAALVAASATSLVDALKVGVQIEELDLSDIAARQVAVDNDDILLVYDNLSRGSRNHLRAFMRQLVQLGGSYTPQYLSQAAFNAIVNSPMENGR